MREDEVYELVDRLIGCWDVRDVERDRATYFDDLIPEIVRAGSEATRLKRLMPSEASAVAGLREGLDASEWERLADLVSERLGVDQRERERLAARNKELREAAREEERRARRRRIEDAEAAARSQFDENFLAARQPPDSPLTPQRYGDLRAGFVREWAAREFGLDLDSEQAAAVGAVAPNVLVTARAGSGKTRTLVTRALFLIRHCGVSPRDLMLLAFNKRAAQEMKSRLNEALRGEVPYVMTFHALAYAIVQPPETLVRDDSGTGEAAATRLLQQVVDEALSSHGRSAVGQIMLRLYRDDLFQRLHRSASVDLDALRRLPRETLRGEWVKSYGEKVIANALFEHGIEYRYEAPFTWDGVVYRPDFTVRAGADSGVAIEYFGLAGDPDYDEAIERKRDYWKRKKGWRLLELYPHHFGNPSLNQSAVGRLLTELQASGFAPRQLTDAEIWERIERRAVGRFARAMSGFVSRCRSRGWDHRALAARVDEHETVSRSEELFLTAAIEVLEQYLLQLERGSCIDFSGLVWRAAAQVRGGNTLIRSGGTESGDLRTLRHVLVDEFQDFSPMFDQLVQAIRHVNATASIFGVGDDWQAINGFAGSELSYFHEFESHFGAAERHHITTNYRSDSSVVETGNRLMRSHGEPAKAASTTSGTVEEFGIDAFEPTKPEITRHADDCVTPAVLRLVRRLFDSHGACEVTLLSRTNGPPRGARVQDHSGVDGFLEHLRRYLPPEERSRVKASTAHSFKGLETDAVIIVDAVGARYPLIHPTWIFSRIFGDSQTTIEEADRRLLYVALTRARNHVALLTDRRDPSGLVTEALGRGAQPMKWSEAPAPRGEPLVEIRVRGAYHLREKLKASSFRWNSLGENWWKMVPAHRCDAVVIRERWLDAGASAVEFYDEDGTWLE